MNNHDQYDQFKTVGETNTVGEAKSDISLFSSTVTIAFDRYKSNSHLF